MYLVKTKFKNENITLSVKNAIDNKDLLPPKDRPHLESRTHFKMNDEGVMKYTGDDNVEKFSQIASRLDKAIKLHGPRVKSFVQYSLPPDLEQFVIDNLPIRLSILNPKIAVQVINGGQACTPHKDHSKQCSMFYLFSEPNVKTVWWEKTDDFEEFDDFRYGDPDKLQIVHDEIIEQNSWYVFNNSKFHSIHLISGTLINRISLLIEFDIDAEELYKLINAE